MVQRTAPAPGQPTITDPAPPATTVAESGTTVDVVQARFSEAHLRQTQARVMGALRADGINVYGAGVAMPRNRVTMRIADADDTVRATVAQRLPVDEVCIDGPPPAPPTGPITQITTLIPTDPDPWIV